MNESIKKRIRMIREDSKLMSGIYMVTLVTALLVLALVIKGPEKSGTLIADSDGRISGINRERLDRSERYELELSVIDGKETISRNVSLTLQARGNESPSDHLVGEDKEAELEAGIDSVISEIEYSKDKKISLPDTLPDGTEIMWKAAEKKTGSLVIIIPAVYLGLIALMLSGTVTKDKTSEEKRKAILRGLPRFCNQLFLMMNAGLILSDAFDTITGSYGEYDESELSSFEKEIAALSEATDGHRISTAHVINEYAVKNDVKELIRIASILNENEKRGSNVIESLERESRYLWDERKIVAREAGKAIDTKMSYPLGLLLILLIVITMAPALLSM